MTDISNLRQIYLNLLGDSSKPNKHLESIALLNPFFREYNSLVEQFNQHQLNSSPENMLFEYITSYLFQVSQRDSTRLVSWSSDTYRRLAILVKDLTFQTNSKENLIKSISAFLEGSEVVINEHNNFYDQQDFTNNLQHNLEVLFDLNLSSSFNIDTSIQIFILSLIEFLMPSHLRLVTTIAVSQVAENHLPTTPSESTINLAHNELTFFPGLVISNIEGFTHSPETPVEYEFLVDETVKLTYTT